MPGNVTVGSTVRFASSSNYKNNIIGNMATNKISRVWDFTELTLDTTNQYTVELDTTSTIAIGAGGCLLTTAATDTKVASLALGGLFWYPAKNPIVEFTFQLDVVTTVAIYAGFSDAVTEGTAKLPFSLITATLSDWATDAAGFLFDTRQTLSYFNIVNTKNNTEAFTQLASTRVPVAATNLTLRVAIDTAGKARYFWNGMEVGAKTAAVSTTVPLIPFFGIRNNTATAHVAKLRRVRAWCDE